MTPADASAALPVVGAIAALGLFLPDIDQAWDASDTDGRMLRRLRVGEAVYLGAAVAIAGLASYGQGSPLPLVVGVGLAVGVVAMQEWALRQPSEREAPGTPDAVVQMSAWRQAA